MNIAPSGLVFLEWQAMISKRSIVVALAGINLFLLIALVLGSYSLPKALAQRAGAASNFVAVTAKADADLDALFLIDLGNRTMHCFLPSRDRSGNVEPKGSRNLEQDFGR